MARDRTELQSILEEIMADYADPNDSHVYYQPPASVRMRYPCIVYSLSSKDPTWADNRKYLQMNRYSVTVIDYDADSTIPDEVEALPWSRFERMFAADRLNHFTYNLYF